MLVPAVVASLARHDCSLGTLEPARVSTQVSLMRVASSFGRRAGTLVLLHFIWNSESQKQDDAWKRMSIRPQMH